MPFEVFRRHQKKMLAVLAIFAMVAFTLDFSLFRNSGAVGPRLNDVAFNLYGEPVTQRDLLEIKVERLRANRFMQALNRMFGPEWFGGTTDEQLQDALILQHEADRLEMPRTPEVAKLWLRDVTGGQLTPAIFDEIYRENFSSQDGFEATDEQVLADLANQIRLQQVSRLPGGSFLGVDLSGVTPLDVYRSFRDQNERVSANFVAFTADSYVGEVGEPSEAEVRAFYEKYRDALPDPERPTPGFRSPRTIDVEYVVMDQRGLVEKFERELTTEEVRKYFEENSTLFPHPRRELPVDLFAGDEAAALTPEVTDPFAKVAPFVREQLAFERGRDAVTAEFERIQAEVFDPFIVELDEAEYGNDEAKDLGKPLTDLPEPFNKADGESKLKADALAHDRDYARTGPLTREAAETDLTLAGTSIGTMMPSNGPPFSSFVFDPRSAVYEPFEMADAGGRRYLAWKLEDRAPSTPPLAESRDQVVQAWKLDRARAKAKAAAEAIAAKAEAAGGKLEGLEGLDKPVETTADVARLSVGFDSRPNEIPPLSYPSPALRDAYFGLKPGEVAVVANAPESTYYVLTLRDRTPADLQSLFGPAGVRAGLESQVGTTRTIERDRLWVEYLRKQAGVEPESIPTTTDPS